MTLKANIMERSRVRMVTTVVLLLFSSSYAELREYCWEAFNATCPSSHEVYHSHPSHSDHLNRHSNQSTPTTPLFGRVVEDSVIMMIQAFYGRMKRQQCIKGDYQIGCHRNVLNYMDRLCSGRSSCVVGIPHAEMHMMQPCPADLRAYLEADYSCVRVLKAAELNSCLQHKHLINLSGAPVFLIDHPTYKCSFLVSVQKGQRINITLFDFSSSSTSSSPSSSSSLSSTYELNRSPPLEVNINSCVSEFVYAVLRNLKGEEDVTNDGRECDEDGGGCGERIPVICGGKQRESSTFLSLSHAVSINLINQPFHNNKNNRKDNYDNDANKLQPRFMILLEVVGCPDPMPPINGWVERSGFDKVTVHCNHTIAKWYLVCNHNAWVGHYKNCATPAEIFSEDSLVQSSNPYPVGIFVAVTIGIALGVFCGLLLLSMVICCQKNKNNNHYRNYNIPSGSEDQASETCQTKTNKSQLVMADKFYYDLSNQPSYRVQAGICSCVVQDQELSLPHKQAPSYDPCLALKQLQPIRNDHALTLDFCSPSIGRHETNNSSSTAYDCKPYVCREQRQVEDCDEYKSSNKLDKYNSAENLGFTTNNSNNMTLHEINS